MEDHCWRIGVDEAGYGPNLGPLVVAASAGRAPRGADLDAALASAVARAPRSAAGRVVIADSKALYHAGGGLAPLELPVYAVGGAPATWTDLVRRLGADPDGAAAQLPWHEGFDSALPLDATPASVHAAGRAIAGACSAAGVGPVHLAARLVHPPEFNRLVGEHGTKGAALSSVSIALARRLLDRLPDAPTPAHVVFDKHGGRNRYGALLQQHFPEGWVEARKESRATSRYRCGERLTFEFRAKGESELPVALASMTAKLLREVSMIALNAFWTARVPGLRPTAGYPVDAKRFRKDISRTQATLGIDEALLWRNR